MRFLRPLGLFAVATSCLICASCLSNESQSETGGSGGGIVTSGTGGASGSGAGAGSGNGGSSGGSGGPACPPPTIEVPETPQWIDSLDGRVVDLDGNPAANIQATVCGIDICIYGSTNDQGYVVTCDDQTGLCTKGISPLQTLTNPAFKFALGINYVKWAYRLPEGSTFDVGTFVTSKLPDISTGAEIVAGADATSDGITLSVGAGGSIEFDILIYELPEQMRFRAVNVPMDKLNQAVDTSLGFGIVIGTTPVETLFCPPAKLSVPNTAGWAAGTEVEFFAHGVTPLGEWTPYAGWEKVSGGSVSADGKLVVTNDGEGVPLLTAFGIRKKP